MTRLKEAFPRLIEDIALNEAFSGFTKIIRLRSPFQEAFLVLRVSGNLQIYNELKTNDSRWDKKKELRHDVLAQPLSQIIAMISMTLWT